ncbi:DNA cytosine methyltransferase [Sulfuricurvum sp.]|uniref:DNA cytosine methyltransferase n=1 Tax=Sulfuricurvum sp. TaxID=2025608 RepID=UPI003C5C3BBE
MNNSIIAIDLFCGVGGVTRGLLDAGIDVVGGFDIEPAAKKAYEENNKRPNGENAKYFLQSVTELKKKQIFDLVGTKSQRKKEGKKFLLAGCAPCQPFSMKNKKRGDKEDKRRTLITYFANLIRDTEPDFVFMENVAGLEKFEPDNFKYFTDILDEKGYSWDKKIVNALHYGVPQNRKRFVLLAAKKGEVTIPDGEYDGVSKSYKTVGDVIRNLDPIEAGESHPVIPNHRASNLSPTNKERLKYKNRLEWPEELWLECHKKMADTQGHTDSYGRIEWGNPAPTLTTKFFSISNGRYAHPEQSRGLSLREGALLQSFPKDYEFFDESMQKVARQIGNAVPPKMAEAFGKYFLHSV